MDNKITKIENNASIGSLLLDAGKINLSDAERIIALQKQKGLRFGDAAKSLGLIDDEDIQKALAYQFDYPYLKITEESFSQQLVAAYQPFSPQVEALRAIRGQLMMRWLVTHKTLAVISLGREEGRSCLVANLAIVFSQLGERTLVIDADLRNPIQHELFKLDGNYGLSDLLVGRADKNVIKRIPAFRDLSILPAGTVPPNPVELISRGLRGCLQELQDDYDVILIDTPSADQGIEAQITATCSGGALILARQHKTRLNELKMLKETLVETGSQCLGAIMAEF
jgi:chain length determinant protein tyrosine kinase EpsG